MTGFEPATTSTPCWYATRLRYIPDDGNELLIAAMKQEYLTVMFKGFLLSQKRDVVEVKLLLSMLAA